MFWLNKNHELGKKKSVLVHLVSEECTTGTKKKNAE
jgi:hypothetical protein